MTASEAFPEPDVAPPRNGLRGETDTVDKMVERVTHDLEYIRRWSFGFDLRIIGLTVFGRGVRQNAY